MHAAPRIACSSACQARQQPSRQPLRLSCDTGTFSAGHLRRPGVALARTSSSLRCRAASEERKEKAPRMDNLAELGKYFKDELAELVEEEDETIEVFFDGEAGDGPSVFDGLDFEDEDEDFEGDGGVVEEDEEIFSLDSGWSVDAFDSEGGLAALGLGAEKGGIHPDLLDTEELGMAASALLRSVPDHVVRRLEGEQKEADEHNEKERKRRAGGGGGTKPKTQRRLRIIGGTASGIRIHSQVGDLTRPMMEKVRGAVFDSITSRLGGYGLPEETRWLDLFAGTGSVGIEGLSRGCSDAHFIELDPWVVENVLEPNLELTSMASRAAVHQMKAEQFLQKARDTPRFAGGAFDFISVCPPYLLVSYPELYDLLEGSPLLHEDTHIVVEYPKEVKHQIRDSIGPLRKVRDKKYGRTFIALYGADE